MKVLPRSDLESGVESTPLVLLDNIVTADPAPLYDACQTHDERAVIAAYTSDTNIQPIPTYEANGAYYAALTDVTVPWNPATYVAGDLGILVVISANQTITLSDAQGFVAMGSPQGTGTPGAAGAIGIALFYCFATSGSMPSPTVADPGANVAAYIVTFRGVADTGNPWDVITGGTAASSTAVSVTGVTTTEPNCLAVAIVANAIDSGSGNIHFSGWADSALINVTEAYEISSTMGTGGGTAIVTGEKAAPGSCGTLTATLNAASAQAWVTFALRPPSATDYSVEVGFVLPNGEYDSAGAATTVTFESECSALAVAITDDDEHVAVVTAEGEETVEVTVIDADLTVYDTGVVLANFGPLAPVRLAAACDAAGNLRVFAEEEDDLDVDLPPASFRVVHAITAASCPAPRAASRSAMCRTFRRSKRPAARSRSRPATARDCSRIRPVLALRRRPRTRSTRSAGSRAA
jgi:hypothetical protein